MSRRRHKEEITTSASHVKSAMADIDLVVAMNDDVWQMVKGVGRLITRSPDVLQPLREPNRGEQGMLDNFAYSLGGSRGASRFNKPYRRYLRYAHLNRRLPAERVERLLYEEAVDRDFTAN